MREGPFFTRRYYSSRLRVWERPFFTRDTLCLPADLPQLLHFLRENVLEVFAVHFAVEVDEGGLVSGLGKGEYACTESRHINMTNVPKKG